MKIEIFNNENFGEVRVLADERGEPWFVGKDVAKILGYRKASNMVRNLDEDEAQKMSLTDEMGRNQEMVIINESGLYSDILRSNKPEAKKFRKWITKEVIPAIRKHGMYMTNDVIETIHKDPKQFLIMVNDYVAAIEKLKLLSHTKKTYTTTEIAKELGFKSARELNEKLSKKGIQYKINNTWILKAKYSTLGYIETKQGFKANNMPVYYPRWTQKGREFLIELFAKDEPNTNEVIDDKNQAS